MKHITRLDVLMHGARVGGLASATNGEIWFEYDRSWAVGGIPLSPMRHFLLRSGAFKAENNTFNGLHGLYGLFSDTLPDGWGLLLMDRALKTHAGWSPHEISPLDRLSYMGDRAMGALEYHPAMEEDGPAEIPDLATLAEAALFVEEGGVGEILSSLYIQGGSPGGARPKVTVAIKRDGSHCLSGFGQLPDDYDHWIVKFKSMTVVS